VGPAGGRDALVHSLPDSHDCLYLTIGYPLARGGSHIRSALSGGELSDLGTLVSIAAAGVVPLQSISAPLPPSCSFITSSGEHSLQTTPQPLSPSFRASLHPPSLTPSPHFRCVPSMSDFDDAPAYSNPQRPTGLNDHFHSTWRCLVHPPRQEASQQL
jgi:hypothetical protein